MTCPAAPGQPSRTAEERPRMLTVKAAADATGLTVKGIRFYEKIGLIRPAQRSPAGYRLYSEEDVARLHQIHFYREQKFSLEDIDAILNNPDTDLRSYLKRQLFDVEEQIQQLERVRNTLDRVLRENNCRSAVDDEVRDAERRSRYAIVSTDLQNEFLEGGSMYCRRIYNIIEPLRAMLERARAMGIPVIYVRDSHHRNDPELEIWPDHCLEGTWGAQIIDALSPAPEDYVLKKNYFNAFIGTKLQATLKKLGTETIIFTGWRTHVCVAQTAIEAFQRGYRILVAGDCVDSTTQVEHECGLNMLQVNYCAEILPGQEILNILSDEMDRDREKEAKKASSQA